MTAVRALTRLGQTRAPQPRRPRPLNVPPVGPPGPFAALDVEAMRDWLRSAIAGLPPHQAEVFAMHCYGDMSCGEIASIVGAPRGRVRIILREARQQLQEMLPAVWVAPGSVGAVCAGGGTRCGRPKERAAQASATGRRLHFPPRPSTPLVRIRTE
jgi:Sigma-70, region 4